MRRFPENGDECEFGDCHETAKWLAYSRRNGCVMALCEHHQVVVVDEDSPEYHHTCENCGCELPIN